MIVSALALFLLSFTGSFLFAGFETGLVSVNSVKVQFAHKENRFGAVSLASLLTMQSRVVATVLIGNNIALVGMQSSFETLISSVSENVSSEAITAMLTVLALIFCELLPKSLFRIYSFRMSLFFSPLIRVLNWLCTPFTKIFDLVTSMGGKSAESVVTSELHAIATEGGRKRELNPMVSNLSEVIFSIEKNGIEGFLCNQRSVDFDKTIHSNFEMSHIDAGSVLNSDLLLGKEVPVVVSLKGEKKVYSSKDLLESLLYS